MQDYNTAIHGGKLSFTRQVHLRWETYAWAFKLPSV